MDAAGAAIKILPSPGTRPRANPRKVSPAKAPADREVSLLIVGDSLTHVSIYPNDLAKRLTEVGPRLYTPIGHDRLTDDAEIRSFIISSVSVVGRQWRDLILSDPLAYLAVRAQDFGWLFLSQHPHACLIYAVGVIGPVADLNAARLTFRYDGRDHWLDEDYAAPLVATPVFSHPVFAAAGLFCLCFLLLRRRPADLAIAAFLVAVLLYTLSYFVIAISCQYRYLYVIDLSAIGASLYVLADLRRH